MRKKQKIKTLYRKYPLIFKESRVPFECRDGWYKILDELCQELTNFLKEHTDVEIHISQIKEKFGTLRFYYSTEILTIYCNAENLHEVYDPIYKQISHLVDIAENKSNTTCEVCGAAGKIRGGSWIQTLCDECHQESLIHYIDSFDQYLKYLKYK